MGALEPGDPIDSRREQNPVTQLGGAQYQTRREVRFAGSGRPEQDDVGSLTEERAGGQVRDRVPFEGSSRFVVNVLP